MANARPTPKHPQAKFDPIPPDLDLQSLVDRTPNFQFVQRLPASKIRKLEFEKLVSEYVIKRGKPLVIEGWQGKLPKSIFSPQFLEMTYDKKQEDVRDINSQTNIPMTMGHYLRSMRQLTDQWTPDNFRDERRQRLYLKDIDCPPEWYDYLRKIIPPGLFYWNENVEEHGGPKDDSLFMDEKTAAPAGDLMSSLPEDMRAHNLMCYIGHEGTYTPAHREMCASLGQNIMVESSTTENGEKEGSSIWFMTETKDREVVREYFMSMLGHDVEIEKHFAQINAWKKANFPVYIVEQKVGDFILIPPLAPHQVWNRGTRTMKVAWNRTTVETLDYALQEALPKARLVCRDEQYKNKAIVYFTLKKYYDMLKTSAESQVAWLMGEDGGRDSARLAQLKKDFKKLLRLFTNILVDEVFVRKEKNVELIPFDSNITCSYCRCNIFNKFLTCPHCIRDLIGGVQDTYDICMECYAMGRSCLCVSGLVFCEQWEWSELTSNYDAWREMVILDDGFVDIDKSPPPLEIARMRIGRKSLAQVCQEQLDRRPFNDITKPDKEPTPEPDEPVEVDDRGLAKKPKRKKKKGDLYKCHTCSHKDYTYRLAFCRNPGCTQAYCYGVLYRAFDMMPQEVLQEEYWLCPKCRGICNCGACRRAGNTDPYEPKNTYIGHDTRAVADDRSQEVLVDFRVHNLNWLKAAGDESRVFNSKRIQRLRQEADAEKDKDQDVAGALADGAQSNGFGTEVQAADVDASMYDGDAPAVQQPVENDELAALHELADPNASLYPEAPTYPEPPGVERRLGIGYYEQADAPDRILFDHYEEPTEDPTFDEESEFVKKSLRAAKRRARQEDDNDPDFIASKSHKKKRKIERPSVQDPLHNVDPALLESGDMSMSMMDAPPLGENQADGADMDAEDWVPALRTSRPKVSYADMEDIEDIEEFNETLPSRPKTKKASKPRPAPVPGTDPLDLAAEAMRVLTNPEAKTPRKRQGRPPGSKNRPRESDVALHSSPSTIATPNTASGKRRGRPPRSSLAISAVSLDTDESDAAHNETINELEQELAKELEEDASYGERTSKSTPGQKRRGRPPKNRTESSTSARPAHNAPVVAASSEKFLSMAERMALRGKKIKIGQRKGRKGTAEPSDTQNQPANAVDATDANSPVQDPQEPESEVPQMPESEAPQDPETLQEPETFEEAVEAEDDRAADDDEEDDGGYAPMHEAGESDDPDFEEATSLAQEESPAHTSEDEDDQQSGDDAVSSRPAIVGLASKASSVIPARSRLGSVTTANGATVIMKESRDPSTDGEDESPQPSPVQLPKPTGPTVVRIGDSDNEEEYNYYSDSFSGSGAEAAAPISDDEDEDDDSDGSIPAKAPAKPILKGRTATRGGQMRGRGRVRGRGRGRGRGRT